MKRLILILSIICFGTFCFSGSAFADIDVSVDTDTSVVTVSIRLENAQGKKVAVEVLKPGKSEADIASLTPSNIAEVIAYIKEVRADKSGYVNFSFCLGNESGKYSVRAKAQGDDAVFYKDAIVYVSPSLEEDFLNQFNNEKLSNYDRLALLNAYSDILGINVSAFDVYPQEFALTVVDFVGSGFSDVQTLKDYVELGVTATMIGFGSEADEVSSAIETYRFAYENQIPNFELFDKYLTKNEKSKIYSSLDAEELLTADEYIDAFAESLFLYSIKNVDGHQHVESILRVCEQWLGEEFGDYYNLTNKKNVNLIIMKGNYQSAAELCKALHSEVRKTEKGKEKSPSGGGSSVTSGSSVNVVVNNPTANSVTGIPVQPNCDFADLDGALWAKEAIVSLAQRGVVNGVADGIFAPSRTILREEFVKILVGALFEIDTSATLDFSDVSSSHWSYPYICTAVKLGIVNGVTESKFGMGLLITRQDMAVMLNRAVDAAGIVLDDVEKASVSDTALISDYATDSVEKMVSGGIINGYEDGSFAPFESTTRAQAAKVIYEVLKKEG
ncbi:MAG: S-layer homology domain-containing protein [Clostridia bacterium]|nr:S-layer homology domain-containing protein [Clostridia bacterium]